MHRTVDSNSRTYTVTVSDPIGNTLAIAYAYSYLDAATFADSLADDHPYACSITVSITYPVCSADRKGVLHE